MTLSNIINDNDDNINNNNKKIIPRRKGTSYDAHVAMYMCQLQPHVECMKGIVNVLLEGEINRERRYREKARERKKTNGEKKKKNDEGTNSII